MNGCGKSAAGKGAAAWSSSPGGIPSVPGTGSSITKTGNRSATAISAM